MKLRLKGHPDLCEAVLLEDDPECEKLGYPVALRIQGPDGEEILADPKAAAAGCQLVWATQAEREALARHGFFAQQ